MDLKNIYNNNVSNNSYSSNSKNNMVSLKVLGKISVLYRRKMVSPLYLAKISFNNDISI